jgi:hypothetical protein
MSKLKYLQRVIGLFVLLALCACSQNTKVHLYGRYLSASQTNDVRQALSAQGFDVTLNQLAFPTNISQSTLIYGMPMDRPQEVDHIKQIAKVLGWLIQDAQSLVKGNHWYSGNAVGLFLLPEGVSPHQLTSVHDLSFSYQSQQCADQPELRLTADQRFQIIPVAGATAEPAMLQGRWQVRQLPYLELLPDGDPDWSYYLEISRKQHRDMIGEVQQLTLTPLQTYLVFGQCSFVFGIRQP